MIFNDRRRQAEAAAGRNERMAVDKEATRLQQPKAFQSDGGMNRKNAYAKAAQNYDAGKMGGK